jgi:hypothetical protein
MRALQYFVVIPALALLTMACGPHHGRCGGPGGPPCRGGERGMMMMHHGGGGPGACAYKSRWYSQGAIQSNDGACQACSSGNWVPATGCDDHGGCGACHDCGGKKGGKSGPCHHHDGGSGHRHDRKR